MKRLKLQKLLGKLTSFDTEVDDTFSSLDKEMANVTAKLKETITAKTLDQVNTEFKKLQDSFKPLLSAFEDLKSNISSREKRLIETLDFKLKELRSSANSKDYSFEIQQIQNQISNLSNKKIDIPDFSSQILETEQRLETLIGLLPNDELKSGLDDIKKQVSILEDSFKKIREVIINRNQSYGGGNANRQIRVEGVDVLTKYTDINIYGVTSSVISSVDNTNKRVNIGIQGGGGGGLSYHSPTSGIVNGSNTLFVWDTAPDIIFVDGVAKQLVSSDGTVNWTLAGTTTTLVIAPVFDIFSLS